MGMIELKLLQDRMDELEKKIESINTNADMPVNQLLYFQDYKQYKDDSYVHTDPQIKAELFKCPLFFNDPLAKEETFTWFAENCDGEMDRIFRTYNPLKEIGFKGCDYFRDLFSIEVLEENEDYLTAIHNAGDDFIFKIPQCFDNFRKSGVKDLLNKMRTMLPEETLNYIFDLSEFRNAINASPDCIDFVTPSSNYNLNTKCFILFVKPDWTTYQNFGTTYKAFGAVSYYSLKNNTEYICTQWGAHVGDAEYNDHTRNAYRLANSLIFIKQSHSTETSSGTGECRYINMEGMW